MALTTYENVPVIVAASITFPFTVDRTYDLCMALAVGDTDADIPSTPIPWLLFYNKETRQVSIYNDQTGWSMLAVAIAEESTLSEPLIFFNTSTGFWGIYIGTNT